MATFLDQLGKELPAGTGRETASRTYSQTTAATSRCRQRKRASEIGGANPVTPSTRTGLLPGTGSTGSNESNDPISVAKKIAADQKRLAALQFFASSATSTARQKRLATQEMAREAMGDRFMELLDSGETVAKTSISTNID